MTEGNLPLSCGFFSGFDTLHILIAPRARIRSDKASRSLLRTKVSSAEDDAELCGVAAIQRANSLD
jgi:hypothetical protein